MSVVSILLFTWRIGRIGEKRGGKTAGGQSDREKKEEETAVRKGEKRLKGDQGIKGKGKGREKQRGHKLCKENK